MINLRLSVAIAGIVCTASGAAYCEDLADALQRLGLQSALVVHSAAIDEHPIWSPKGDALAVNIESKWFQVPLSSITLVKAQWHGGSPIGVVQPPPKAEPIDEKTARSWERAGKWAPRKIQARDGTVLELRQEELSTEFLITRKGARPESQWKSGMESCHSLVLSPDENYIAFICELNGVVVTRLSER